MFNKAIVIALACLSLALGGCTIGELKSFAEANITMDLTRAIQQNHDTRHVVDRAESEIISDMADYLKGCINSGCPMDEMTARQEMAVSGLAFLRDNKPPLYTLRLLDEPEVKKLLGRPGLE